MDRTSMRTMRYLFFGVGLVGGVILLAAGQTLIGGYWWPWARSGS